MSKLSSMSLIVTGLLVTLDLPQVLNAFKVTQSHIKTNQVSGKPRPPVFSRDQREIVKSAKVEVMMMICGLVENNISHLWSYEDEDGFGFKYFCSLYVLITFKR